MVRWRASVRSSLGDFGFAVVVGGSGDGWVLLHVRGEVDMSARDELERALDRALAGGRSALVDMSDTTFLDCGALGVLCRDRWRQGRIRLVDTSAQVKRLLVLTDVDRTHPRPPWIHRDRAESDADGQGWG